MRTTALALLALLAIALLPPADAQPSFSQAYQVRAAVGDIPTTPAAEAAGQWNVEQRLTVDFDNASAEAARTYHFTIPAGATLVEATCDCAQAHNEGAGPGVTIVIDPQTASGGRTLRVVSRQPAGQVLGLSVIPPMEAPADRVVILYAPTGSEVDAPVRFTEVGPAPSDGSKTIHYATFSSGSAMPGDFWLAIHPATTAGDGTSGGKSGPSAMAWLLPAIAGVVLGAILWAALVSKGVVQAKSRRQVVQTAAHVEAASTDPPAVLEGKKRALLAALKEVELAKQANEMPVEVYDAVKADLKKQAVTVMRALESGESKA